MKVTLLCTDENHPVNRYLREWMAGVDPSVSVELVRKKSDAKGGELLFLVSCGEIVTAADRSRYLSTLVLHASDLPRGRGWNPHIWDIVNGAEAVTLSMLEAEDKVDSGRIWKKKHISVPKTALWNEINDLVFRAEVEMIQFAIEHFRTIAPEPQPTDVAPTYFRKRTPEDSRIDPEQSIAAQFDLIRVCDPNRFPAFFDHLGVRYSLIVERCNEQ